MGCDWRINVHNCEGDLFFQLVHLIALSCASLVFAISIGILLYRIFIRKDPLKTFQKGQNAALISFILEALINTSYHLIILFFTTPLPLDPSPSDPSDPSDPSITLSSSSSSSFPSSSSPFPSFLFDASFEEISSNLIVNHVAWSVMVTAVTLPPSVYLGNLVESLPEGVITDPKILRAKACISSPNLRLFFLLSLQFLYSLLSSFLFGYSSFFGNQPGQETRQEAFFLAGLGFLTVYFVVYMAVYSYFAAYFLSILGRFLKGRGKVFGSAKAREVAGIIFRKTRSNIYLMITNMASFVILYLLLLNYRSLFDDLNVSKPVGAIYICFLEVIGLIAVSQLILSDVKLAHQSKREKDSPSFNSSKAQQASKSLLNISSPTSSAPPSIPINNSPRNSPKNSPVQSPVISPINHPSNIRAGEEAGLLAEESENSI